MPVDILFVLRGHPEVVSSTRERVIRYLPHLEQHGIAYRLVIPPRRARVQFYLWPIFYLRILLLGLRSRYVFVQKDVFMLWVWRVLRAAGKKLIYDFDDAVFVAPPKGRYNVFHQTVLPQKGADSVARMIHLAHQVTVANEFLARFARQHNKDVQVIPVPVQCEKLAGHKEKSQGQLVIGWLGSPLTAPYLALLEPVLQQLKKRFGDQIRFRFITRARVPLTNVEFEQKPWDAASEYEDILNLDIGVVPLPQGDSFAEGKSSYKLMQFMAAGLPVVCSAVGYNNEVVTHGQNGFLAGSTQEWLDCLSELIRNQPLRQNMGAAARKYALANFDLRSTSVKFLNLFASPVAG